MEAALWVYFLAGPTGALAVGAVVVRWIVQERRR